MSEILIGVDVHDPALKKVSTLSTGSVIVTLGGEKSYTHVTLFFDNPAELGEFIGKLAVEHSKLTLLQAV